jgi:integrase
MRMSAQIRGRGAGAGLGAEFSKRCTLEAGVHVELNSWLSAVGTPVEVQQKLMRHADIRTTMNVYGEVVTDEMAQAASKVEGLAVNGR